MNSSNLRTPSTNEAREIGRLGGIASGKSRRKRKAIRTALEEALTLPYEVNGTTLSNVEAIAAAMVREAREGNVRAFCAIRDSCEGRPVQGVSVRTDVIAPETYDVVRKMLEEA